jgi:hypothetical protein
MSITIISIVWFLSNTRANVGCVFGIESGSSAIAYVVAIEGVVET